VRIDRGGRQLPVDRVSAWAQVIGEHGRGSHEDGVVQLDPSVDRDVVLDPTTSADPDVGIDVDVAPQRGAGADDRTGPHVAQVPDHDTVSERGAILDLRRRVYLHCIPVDHPPI